MEFLKKLIEKIAKPAKSKFLTKVILIDGPNVQFIERQLEWKIDYLKLVKLLEQDDLFHQTIVIYYYPIKRLSLPHGPIDQEILKKIESQINFINFATTLLSKGLGVRIFQYEEGGEKYTRKDIDAEVFASIWDFALDPMVAEIIVVSDDGHFAPFLKNAGIMGKKIKVVGNQDGLAAELHEFKPVILDDMKELIEFRKINPSGSLITSGT